MKISLKKKKLKSGKLSLYLEFYKGSTKDSNGKIKHFREFEYLNIYLIDQPKTADEKRENKEKFALAENIKSIRESEFIQGKYKIADNRKLNIGFIEYFDKLLNKRSDYLSNYNTWKSTKRYIDQYVHPSTTFRQVDLEFVNGFKEFLDKKAITKNGTPLAAGSKYSYFNRFRTVIRNAYEDGYLSENLISKVKNFDQLETKREYLTLSELQSLFNTDCKYEVLKKAFLFSCLTGLRWSDVHKLVWEEVRDEDDSCKIIFRQKKTDGVEYLYISKEARELLGERKLKSDRVFTNLQYGVGITTELLRWCMKAGITKHITYHSSRHTNAVLLLENGADIYTVQKRLGHKEIRTTEIYAKIIDKKMREAAELIPNLKN